MTVNIARISRIGSEHAIGGNNIVTHDGVCRVVWQDVSREGYLNRVRSYRYDTGQWTKPATLNIGVDNNARPVITVDHEGRRHIVLSGHGTPVTYCSSIGINDSSACTPEQPAGSGTPGGVPHRGPVARGRQHAGVRARRQGRQDDDQRPCQHPEPISSHR